MNATIPSPYPEGSTIGPDLTVKNGRLHFAGVELLRLMTEPLPGRAEPLGSPLEVVFLPKIADQIRQMRSWFAEAMAEIGYPAGFEYAYASKANSSEEVTRTALAAGAHYETSSATDVEIVRYCLKHGLMPPDRWAINNGFKTPGSDYTKKLIELRADGFEHVMPVFEDVDELEPFIESGLSFQVGLRQKIDKHARTVDAIEGSDIRFGMAGPALREAARRIAAAPNLTLVMYHAMQSDAASDPERWLAGFRSSMGIYAALAKAHPSLHIYNWGGGLPAREEEMADLTYPEFITQLVRTAWEVSQAHGIPAPTLLGEFGRYTTAAHGLHLFRVLKAKDNGSQTPWYLIDGSVMSSFPDAWALGLEFQVLPLNHLDKPFQRVRLGGLTCDTDDIYPTRQGHQPLYLPVETEGLYIGVFGIGAYQEMLGGIRGAKHCLLPEASELIIEGFDDGGALRYSVMPEQSYEDILYLLGYRS